MLSCQKVGFLIVTTLLAVGCGERSKLKVGASCLLNSDCNSPLVCTMGKCHEGCKETRDCPAGQSCMLTNGDGICQLPAESDCTTSECLGGWVCATDLRCHTGCLSATNCTKGQTCVDGVCADLAQLVNGELPQRAPSDAGIDLGGPTRDDGGAGTSSGDLSPATTDAPTDYSARLDAGPDSGLSPEADAPAEHPAHLDAKSDSGLSPEAPSDGADARQDVLLPEDGSMGVVDAGTDTTPPTTPIDSQGMDAWLQPDIGVSGPTITNFFAGASSINAGHATTLTAIFSGGTGVITPGDVPVLSGVAVSTGILDARTTFTLTVTSPEGQTAVATVSVAVLMPPQTIAAGSGWLTFLVTDGNNLYYVVGPSILKVANTGGTPVPIAAASSAVSAMATDGTNVYWTDSNEGTVSGVSVSGTEEPVTLATGQYYANTIAVAGDSVYWTTQGSLPPGTDAGIGAPLPQASDTTGFVRKVGIAGGMQPVTLASGQSKPDSIVVYGASVYWKGSSNDLGTVISTVSAVGGDSPRDLAVGVQGAASNLAANSSGLHWISILPPTAGGGIARLTFAGGPPSSVVSAEVESCGGGVLAVDADNAYWTCPAGMSPSLFEAAFDGIGPPVALALTDQSTAQGVSPLAVDATDLYWGRNSSPPSTTYSIVKVHK